MAARHGTGWSARELATLRAWYPREGRACGARLPQRTRCAVIWQAHRQGLRTGHYWTPDDDARLRRLWHDVSPRALRAAFRGRSWNAVYTRAYTLGLPMGVPQGLESVGRAATRCGFAHPTMVRVLEAAGVRPRRAYGGPGSRDGYSHTGKLRGGVRYVDPADADHAVRRWLATETVSAAAAARGLPRPTLRTWLRAAGVLARGTMGRPQRLPSATIDRVVAARLPARDAWLAARAA